MHLVYVLFCFFSKCQLFADVSDENQVGWFESSQRTGLPDIYLANFYAKLKRQKMLENFSIICVFGRHYYLCGNRDRGVRHTQAWGLPDVFTNTPSVFGHLATLYLANRNAPSLAMLVVFFFSVSYIRL